MRKTLIASGCSWTNKNYKSIFHPEMDCSWPKWPELLAEKLDMDCINLGQGGGANNYIYNSLLDQIFSMDINEIGMVISAWTMCLRESYQKTIAKEKMEWRNISQQKLFDTGSDIKYFINRSLRNYFNLQTLCERYKIPYKQIQMLPLYRWDLRHAVLIEYDAWIGGNYPKAVYKQKMINTHNFLFQNIFYDKIDEEKFIGWPAVEELGGFSIQEKIIITEKHTISKEDTHPNTEGQKIIAEFIYENL